MKEEEEEEMERKKAEDDESLDSIEAAQRSPPVLGEHESYKTYSKLVFIGS